ncbi:MAG: asparagine synthase (glutamine-hydrolyzing) [Ferruginibacter sp.]
MCGIAGSINYKLPYEIIKKNMFHRGPDEQNDSVEDNVDLYHLRLSILDVSGGKQPMVLDDQFTIIFNGEIYNHNDLRKQFGLICDTSSDTETILRLYQKLGNACLHYLEGMFVFAIYDNVEKSLFIARDRAGKKPLYYFKDGEKIVFASELNCLKGMLPLEINKDNFYHYTRVGTFYRNLTPYKNVTELPGGSFLKINTKDFSIIETQWWNINDFYCKPNKDNLEESKKMVNHYLTEAVKRRIESSDLEVGCFLSGGIDSGLVTAIGSTFTQKLKTFTVAFDGAYNEAPLARLVAEKYNTHHTEINISFDNLKNDVEKILANYGEPFSDSSAIPSYYVSKEAKKHLTVILNGDGADELFGGYRRYVPFAKYDFFKNNIGLKGTASVLKRFLPQPHNKKSKYNYLYRLASLASKSNLEIYLSAGVDIMEDYENNIIKPTFDYLETVRTDFNIITENKEMSGLQKIMNMDFDTNLFSDLLVKMDIATMANSLEGRSPFMCKDLLEYVPSMSDSFKINGTTTKFLLRDIAKEYLPTELINQPKRGFEIPLKNWVDVELKDMIYDYVGSSNALSKEFVKNDFIQNLLSNKIKIPSEKRAKILWMMFSMEIWHKKNYLHA